MFSAESEKVKFGAASYRWNIPISMCKDHGKYIFIMASFGLF